MEAATDASSLGAERLLSPWPRAVRVRVIVKHGLLGGGRIRVDHVETEVRREDVGIYVVDAPDVWDRAKMRYDRFEDHFRVDLEQETVDVAFHQGEARFTWKDRPYHIASLVGGEVRIDQEGRPVATGVVTVSGLDLEPVEPELLPLIRPLAWGLALYSEEVARGT